MKKPKSNCVPRSFYDIFFLSFLYIVIMYNSQAQREKRGCDEMLVVSASILLSHAVPLNETVALSTSSYMVTDHPFHTMGLLFSR